MLYDAQSTTFRPSNADVRKLANRAGSLTRRHGRRGRVAVVTPQPAAYEKAQTYSHLAEAFDIPMRVFLNRSSAERWLNDSRATDAPTEPA